MNDTTNARIFNTKLYDGSMNLKDYLANNHNFILKNKYTKWEESESKKEFLNNRIKAGLRYGFNGKKIIIPYDIGNYAKGKYFVADHEVYNKADDLWNVSIPGDIVLLKKDNPGIVVAYPVADDPVVIIEDQEHGALALTHCNINKINERIPAHAVSALEKEVGSDVKNLKAYIGPCLKKQSNFYYFTKPNKVKKHKNIWQNCVDKDLKVILESEKFLNYHNNIKEASNLKEKLKIIKTMLNECKNAREQENLLSSFHLLYKIDTDKAITNILIKKGMLKENIIISQINTSREIGYFSDIQSHLGNPYKAGKFLVGAYYEDTFPDYNGTYYTRKL